MMASSGMNWNDWIGLAGISLYVIAHLVLLAWFIRAVVRFLHRWQPKVQRSGWQADAAEGTDRNACLESEGASGPRLSPSARRFRRAGLIWIATIGLAYVCLGGRVIQCYSHRFCIWFDGMEVQIHPGPHQPGWLFKQNPPSLSRGPIFPVGWTTGFVILFIVLRICRDAAKARAEWRRLHPPPLAPPVCLKCGYNLTGNTSGICAECGTAIPKDTLEAGAGVPGERLWVIIGWTVGISALLMLVFLYSVALCGC